MRETATRSRVRSNRLSCTKCSRSIRRGDQALFVLEDGKFQEVYCEPCADSIPRLIAMEIESDHHPFDMD